MTAISGIEIALWDLLGRHLKTPISTFFGGCFRDRIRIYAEGKGESQPVTGERCKGMGKEHRSNAKMVDCLQPDRRTEVEVIGTRPQ